MTAPSPDREAGAEHTFPLRGGAARTGRWSATGCIRCLSGLAAALFALLALLVILHRPILRAIGRQLVVAERPEPADFVFLLNGGVEHRPEVAARLLLENYAPRVLIVEASGDMLVALGVRRTQTEISVAALRHLGIPAERIEVIPLPGGASSTRDEARALAAYLREHPADRVLVVTSDYHTRRTRWTLRRTIRSDSLDLRMIPAWTPFAATEDWWRDEEAFLLGIEEYLKVVHTWLVAEGT